MKLYNYIFGCYMQKSIRQNSIPRSLSVPGRNVVIVRSLSLPTCKENDQSEISHGITEFTSSIFSPCCEIPLVLTWVRTKQTKSGGLIEFASYWLGFLNYQIHLLWILQELPTMKRFPKKKQFAGFVLMHVKKETPLRWNAVVKVH